MITPEGRTPGFETNARPKKARRGVAECETCATQGPSTSPLDGDMLEFHRTLHQFGVFVSAVVGRTGADAAEGARNLTAAMRKGRSND